ncbi:hypothetical protein [Natrialba taiwanensis]|uniref:CopG family transcriptional regulator n=1 Tax=Natrialba taiwanensis DSM 12281 TaxID=1230458 RepID=M0AGX4_9EURY|nr:hypothetical protein [Natrialba taiwanensis]ELY96623.1 hypothetical protein C484_00775 [Natrialba taiwanensis DSM 12281]
MGERKDVTVPMDEEFVEEIEAQLTYGDSRAGWIREACQMRLDGEFDESDDTDTRPRTDGGRVAALN